MNFDGRTIYINENVNSEQLLEWRTHEFSLTEKLNSLIGNSQLEIIFQDWVKPNWWDNYFLNINDQSIFCREIFMKKETNYYWYARTLIPQKCFQLDEYFFNRLKKEALNNLIFNNDTVQRTRLINYPIDSQSIEFNWVNKHLKINSNVLWARLAEFLYQGKHSFYLVEILLPQLEGL